LLSIEFGGGLVYLHQRCAECHLLTCERRDLPDTATEAGRAIFADKVREHLVPTWASLLVVGESRYRIGSSSDEANAAWDRILAKHFQPTTAIAAE